jgi:hypothetical protein
MDAIRTSRLKSDCVEPELEDGDKHDQRHDPKEEGILIVVKKL